jgi:hypothetical protein
MSIDTPTLERWSRMTLAEHDALGRAVASSLDAESRAIVRRLLDSEAAQRSAYNRPPPRPPAPLSGSTVNVLDGSISTLADFWLNPGTNTYFYLYPTAQWSGLSPPSGWSLALKWTDLSTPFQPTGLSSSSGSHDFSDVESETRGSSSENIGSIVCVVLDSSNSIQFASERWSVGVISRQSFPSFAGNITTTPRDGYVATLAADVAAAR